MHPSLLISIKDESQAGEARRQAKVWARGAGVGEEQVDQVALAVTELANNLHRHTTRGGVLILRRLQRDRQVGVEILALDQGPGTANFGRFMHDGYSTAGTPGTGLGAVERASQVFEVFSQAAVGTTLLSQIWPKGGFHEGDQWQTGGVNLPMRHETISGDSWCFCELAAGKARLIVADGLGHGPAAAAASRQAVEIFDANRTLPLADLMRTLHEGLLPTRGAAVAVAEVDPGRETLQYLGVGNVAGALLAPAKTANLISMNGTVGARCEKFQVFNYPYPPDAVLVLATDGLKTQWTASRYPGLLARHPGVIAGTLFRDFQRGTDDATVVVICSRP